MEIKDDMKYIYKFVEKLIKITIMYGSRYAKNGYENNTPIIRKFLTKYIHPFIFNIEIDLNIQIQRMVLEN